MASPVILLDVTRLTQRAHRPAPTGIDRVVAAYAQWLLARPDVQLTPVANLGGRLTPISRARLKTIVQRSGGAQQPAQSASWRELTAVLKAAPGTYPPLRGGSLRDAAVEAAGIGVSEARRVASGLIGWSPPTGAVYLNVAHFGLENPGLAPRLTRAGVRPVVMVHDLIPITHPEFCAAGARSRHERRLQVILKHAHMIIANSAHTADEISRYAASLQVAAPSICVAPLGVEPVFFDPPAPPRGLTPYFLAVGTLEPRKNLAFLLTIWRRLVEQLGPGAPRLVLVGRRGWECESVVDHLERSAAVLSHVHEVSDLHDRELAQLMRGAQALLAPSFAEGYDLPVSEALAAGTSVVASDIAVHRELAPTAHRLDPLDGPAWLAQIEALMRASARGVGRPGPRWETHFESVLAALAPEQQVGRPAPHAARA